MFSSPVWNTPPPRPRLPPSAPSLQAVWMLQLLLTKAHVQTCLFYKVLNEREGQEGRDGHWREICPRD